MMMHPGLPQCCNLAPAQNLNYANTLLVEQESRVPVHVKQWDGIRHAFLDLDKPPRREAIDLAAADIAKSFGHHPLVEGSTRAS